MLNKIVLGMTAKQFRDKCHIPANEPIRPCFSNTEAELMTFLQIVDIGFVIAIPDFQQRKQMLEYQAIKWRERVAFADCNASRVKALERFKHVKKAIEKKVNNDKNL